MRPAIEVYRCASYEDAKLYGSIEGEEAAAAVIEADRAEARAELVAEIVDWMRDEANGWMCADTASSEIEAKFGGRDG